jgi:hypothetical protein
MGAFSGTAIAAINWPASVTAVNGLSGTKLRSIVIPEGITSIESGVFSGCEGLTSVTLPSTIREIRMGAFSECPSLTTIAIPASVREIIGFEYSDSALFQGAPNLNAASRASIQRVWRFRTGPALGM